MSIAFDIRPIHNLLALRAPDEPQPLHLTLETLNADPAPYSPKRARVVREYRAAEFHYTMHPSILIRFLLSRYPAPVYINGQEMDRVQIHEDPAVTRWVEIEPTPEDPAFARKVQIGDVPDHIRPLNYTYDGLAYAHHGYDLPSHDTILAPQALQPAQLFAAVDRYNIQFNISLTAAGDDECEFFSENDTPVCAPSDALRRAYQEATALQRQRAIDIIGLDLTLETLDATIVHQNWRHEPIVVSPHATPVTINHQAPAGRPHPIPSFEPQQLPTSLDYSVNRHLLHHPEFALCPVKPKNDTDLANLTINAVFINDQRVPNLSDPHGMPTAADRVSFELTMTDTDGSTSTIELLTDTALFGRMNHEQPVVVTRRLTDPEELADLMYQAYHRWSHSHTEEDDVRYRQRTGSIATAILRSSEEAYRVELARHWATFAPTSTAPDSDTILSMLRDMIAQPGGEASP